MRVWVSSVVGHLMGVPPITPPPRWNGPAIRRPDLRALGWAARNRNLQPAV
jgi:hypothetical protein